MITANNIFLPRNFINTIAYAIIAPVTTWIATVHTDTNKLLPIYLTIGDSNKTSEKFCHCAVSGRKTLTSIISAFVFNALIIIHTNGNAVTRLAKSSTAIFNRCSKLFIIFLPGPNITAPCLRGCCPVWYPFNSFCPSMLFLSNNVPIFSMP